MERTNEIDSKYLKIGFPLILGGILGGVLVFFFLSVPSVVIFLLSTYLSVTAFTFGIIYILNGFNMIEFSKSKFITVSIIIVGAFIMTIGLDALVKFLFLIL